MAEFEDVQGQLAAARSEVQGREREVRRARDDVDRRKRDRRQVERRTSANPDVPDPPELDALDEDIAARESAVGRRRADLDAARRRERDLLARFRDFTDPRENIGRLSDRIPICLVPLRIEYRFRPAGETGGDTGELWVRVFPDDISVDTFEDAPSETEASDARTYWAGIWSAGGVEAEERGAWAVLLSSQGAGRSFWVTQAYAPLNPEDKPVPPADAPWIILSIPTREPLTEPEVGALRAYWADVWRAGEDAAGQIAAGEALAAAVGDARAQALREAYRPRNLADPPPAPATRADTEVVVAFLHFPTDEEAGVRLQGWATTPEARALPDRLVLLGYDAGELALERLGAPIPPALAVAPDPLAEEDAQIRPDGADLQVGPEMEWITDFDRAVEVGMGFRIPLEPAEFRRGFDQLLVLGVRLRSDAADGKETLEELIVRHHHSKAGFAILPQGRPTNNVEGERSDYRWREDPDVSFDHYFGTPPPDPSGWFEKRDGRWLAEMLGLDAALLATIPHYGRSDISDARAMNVALWPATLGYFMDSMLHPIFDDATIQRMRSFFTRHVTARGTIPAVRVGRQPYGILPVTPRSRLRWMAGEGPVGAAPRAEGLFLQRLYGHLRRIEADLEPLLDRVSSIGKPGTTDPQQVLLDVVGLHPGSVEFQQRYAESLQQLYNRLRMNGAGSDFLALVIALGYAASGLTLLEEFGYTPDAEAETPAILEKFFTRSPNLLKGGLIDDRPMSETDPIRAYTEAGENYIAWLIEAAGRSHEALRLQQGFADGVPRALLYHMLRHALDLSYVETSIRLFHNAGLMTQAELRAARREPTFVQVTEASLADTATAGGSRWQHLYRREQAITGTPERTVGEFIPTVLTTMTATAYLRRQLEALGHLRDRPTAVLERCLAEHLDLCSYRLDAWYGGLMSRQLESLRYGQDSAGGEDEPGTGLYLGAWGWLEEVRPESKSLQPVELPTDLDGIFNADPALPLLSDDTNQGYIHAPSLNHAVTAAILRNGYLSDATPENPGSLAVNLSSERVRTALSMIEGMKADQSLGALLGYQFERGLHDRHDVEVDAFIFDLRKVFPLAGDRLRPTRTGRLDEAGRPVRVQQVEARNVIDGLEFVEHLKGNPQTYPFGLGDDLPSATPAQAAAITAEARRLLDIADAVADLAMAESVHQVAQGNYDRAGAVLDTYAKGKFPATPDVVQTPRSGVTLTQRVALHLPVGLDPADPARISPRARAEPAMDAWLAGVLPAADRVACLVTVTDPAGGPDATHVVTQADLGLAPLDLLYLLDPEEERSGRSLDERVEAHVIAAHAPRPDAVLSIFYRDRIAAVPDHVPFFELAAMVRPLRALLLRSRPLRPTDMSLADESEEALDLDVALDAARITLNRDELVARRDALETFATALEGQLAADPRPTAQIVSEIDQSIDAFTSEMRALAPFAELDTGTGAVFADRRRIHAGLLETLQALLDRWDERLARFDQAIAAYDADPAAEDAAKFRALLVAERFLATTNTDPLPVQPDDFRDDLATTSRAAFVAERDALAALGGSATTVSGLHDALEAERGTIAAFDPEPLDLSVHASAIVTLAEDMARRATTLAEEVTARLAAVQSHLDAADAEADPRRVVEERVSAARLLFGEDFHIVPDFALPPAQAAEWRSAWGPGPTADRTILGHQEAALDRPFPVDDWMTGIARVREKMRALETATRLAEAFGTADLTLEPLQFPNRVDVPWLALDFPETLPSGDPLVLDEDKLLYTGHFAVGFDETARQAGLLLDEWTEVVPSRTEDTGLTFHYDRPNSEPPQTLLLALPAEHTGGWRWEDLVDGVRETMDLARKRAIEPDHVDATPYARFLPAVVSAVTLYPLTAALNFSQTNNLAAALATPEGASDE